MKYITGMTTLDSAAVRPTTENSLVQQD